MFQKYTQYHQQNHLNSGKIFTITTRISTKLLNRSKVKVKKRRFDSSTVPSPLLRKVRVKTSGSSFDANLNMYQLSHSAEYNMVNKKVQKVH